MQIPTCGIVENLPFAEYLACKTHYSSSEIRLVLPPNGTPALLAAKRTAPPEDPNQEHFLVGRALHGHVLERKQEYRITPETYPSEGKSKPWHNGATYCKEWKAKHADMDILSPAQHAEVMQWTQAIRKDEEAQSLLSVPGRSEVSAFAQDPETGLWLKARFDWLPNTGRAIGDIKTSKDVSPRGFANAIVNNLYLAQAAHYLMVFNLIAKENGWSERDEWFFVAVMKKDPYLVKCYRVNPMDLEFGRQLVIKALRTIKHCTDARKWPAFPNEKKGIHTIVLPKYAYNQDDLNAYQPYEEEDDE